MCPTSAERVIKLHLHWWHGDQNARGELIPLLCAELRRLARRYFWQVRPGCSFQYGGQVHEPCLRRVHKEPPQWQSRAHFFGIAARTKLMRHILVDRAGSPLPAKSGAVARVWLQGN